MEERIVRKREGEERLAVTGERVGGIDGLV